MIKTRLEPIGGYGSRIALGSDGTVAGTKDGFYQLGRLVRGRGYDVEGRLGRAAGFGWGRALGLSCGLPAVFQSRLDFNRQTRNGWGSYAHGNRPLQRAGGLQQISGALLSLGATLRARNVALPVSWELEHTSVYRRHGLLAPEATRVWASAAASPSGQKKTASLWERSRSRLFCGDSLERGDGFEVPLAQDASHALRRVQTKRFGIDFNDFWRISSLVRLRVQTVVRDWHNVELTRPSRDQVGVRLERVARREHRATLGLFTPGRSINYMRSLLSNLLPQLWFTDAYERRLESNVTFAGPLRRNEAFRRLVGCPREGGNGAAEVQQLTACSHDGQLGNELLRLTGNIGRVTDATIEGITFEERHERRYRLFLPLLFLPLRSANVSPLHETSRVEGSRSTLRAAHDQRQETFREVSFESNGLSRLHCSTEARASWLADDRAQLKDFTLRSTWTFNGKNEALGELDPERIGEAVRSVNALFGANLRPPGQEMVPCERRVRASFCMQPDQMRAMRARLDKVPNWPALATQLDPRCLDDLRTGLTTARNPEQACNAVSAFVTEARHTTLSHEKLFDAQLVPASVLAMATVRLLLDETPEVTTHLESNHRPAELERANEVVVRYRCQPPQLDDDAFSLHDRAVRVIGAVRGLDALWAVHNRDGFFNDDTHRSMALAIAQRRRELGALLRLPGGSGDAAQQRLNEKCLGASWSDEDRRKLGELLPQRAAAFGFKPTLPRRG